MFDVRRNSKGISHAATVTSSILHRRFAGDFSIDTIQVDYGTATRQLCYNPLFETGEGLSAECPVVEQAEVSSLERL